MIYQKVSRDKKEASIMGLRKLVDSFCGDASIVRFNHAKEIIQIIGKTGGNTSKSFLVSVHASFSLILH